MKLNNLHNTTSLQILLANSNTSSERNFFHRNYHINEQQLLRKETYNTPNGSSPLFCEGPGDNGRYLPKVPSGGGSAVMSELSRFASSCTSVLPCPRRPFFNASAGISGPRLVGYARESRRIRRMWQQLTYECPTRSTAQTQSAKINIYQLPFCSIQTYHINSNIDR